MNSKYSTALSCGQYFHPFRTEVIKPLYISPDLAPHFSQGFCRKGLRKIRTKYRDEHDKINSKNL